MTAHHIFARTFVGFADDVPLFVSCAAVLTLWASIVAERIGHQRGTALTLGKAFAGTTARLKKRVIGREHWFGAFEQSGPTLALNIPRIRKMPEMQEVVLLGRKIRLVCAASGQLRAALRTLPTRDGATADEYVAADPADVERYLVNAFGPRLAGVRTAMECLANRYEPAELNGIGLDLYETFKPRGPHDGEGRKVKAVLEVGKILPVLPQANNNDENSSSFSAPVRRSLPHIAKPISVRQHAYETDQVIVEHCQNVRRVTEAAAKVQASAKELNSMMSETRQLIAESGELTAWASKIQSGS